MVPIDNGFLRLNKLFGFGSRKHKHSEYCKTSVEEHVALKYIPPGKGAGASYVTRLMHRWQTVYGNGTRYSEAYISEQGSATTFLDVLKTAVGVSW